MSVRVASKHIPALGGRQHHDLAKESTTRGPCINNCADSELLSYRVQLSGLDDAESVRIPSAFRKSHELEAIDQAIRSRGLTAAPKDCAVRRSPTCPISDR